MTIDREQLVSFHNPHITSLNTMNPLSAGNGEFAFTVDPSGAQSFAALYAAADVPLCTMSQWAWHTTPVLYTESACAEQRRSYTRQELTLTEYEHNGRTVQYASECALGNEDVYNWLRQNPHRMDIARVGFLLDGAALENDAISSIDQTLCLYDGVIESGYELCGIPCQVQTAVLPDADTILFEVVSPLAESRRLSLEVAFPCGSAAISGADWAEAVMSDAVCAETERKAKRIRCMKVLTKTEGSLSLAYYADDTAYRAEIIADGAVYFATGKNVVVVQFCSKRTQLRIHFEPLLGDGDFPISVENSYYTESAVENANEKKKDVVPKTADLFAQCRAWWHSFWQTCGIIYLRNSRDSRALELERRCVLSLYALAVHCCGTVPPQETGLLCNSWYGKFHLEMHFWHTGALPFWNLSALLERSFSWYVHHIPQASENAASNGYMGLRWPKMVSPDGVDSPSSIAVLLVWQEPHIIYMLESVYRCAHKTEDFLRTYWLLVSGTADFMADFAVQNPENGVYELLPPLIPVQERFDPCTVKNPAFEVSYWRQGLLIAIEWARRLNRNVPSLWKNVAQNMAPPPEHNGVYIAHSAVQGTRDKPFGAYTDDHPSMVFNYSYFADPRIDAETMKHTLSAVCRCWDFQSLWGWDFSALAMAAVRLGMAEKALALLLNDAGGNSYEKNGNNFQREKIGLPAYFPGNGSLLLALAMMTAGFAGCSESLPGFPHDGSWHVEYENILPLWS